MLVISESSAAALRDDYAPRGLASLKSRLVEADRPLFGVLSPQALDKLVREAQVRAGSAGLVSVGAIAMFATLIVGGSGEPDSIEGFAPVLAILRDTRLPEDLRIGRASAMLLDLDEDLPPHLRGLSQTEGTPDLHR